LVEFSLKVKQSRRFCRGRTETGSVRKVEELPYKLDLSRRGGPIAEQLNDIGSDQCLRFGRIMRSASDAHGVDSGSDEAELIARTRCASSIAPLAMERPPCVPSPEYMRIRFMVSTPLIPTPKAKEGGGWTELQERKPGLFLPGDKTFGTVAGSCG
jgi:hypothetical protein